MRSHSSVYNGSQRRTPAHRGPGLPWRAPTLEGWPLGEQQMQTRRQATLPFQRSGDKAGPPRKSRALAKLQRGGLCPRGALVPRTQAGASGPGPRRPPGTAPLLPAGRPGIGWSEAAPPKASGLSITRHRRERAAGADRVSVANSDFKSGHKAETLNMFSAFFPTLATHLILSLRFQFPERR